MDENIREAMNEISEAVACAMQELGEAIVTELEVMGLRLDLDEWGNA